MGPQNPILESPASTGSILSTTLPCKPGAKWYTWKALDLCRKLPTPVLHRDR
jgi:hypothetical protein